MEEDDAVLMDETGARNMRQSMSDSKDATESEVSKKSTRFDIRDLYKMDPEKLSIDVKVSRYSNLAYIQVTPRDVTIDFLEMPGVKRDGKDIVEATRIYMTHVAAQKMVGSLRSLLERVYRDGEMELFSASTQETEPTTEVKRDVEVEGS